MKPIEQAINDVGGITAAAAICGLTYVAVSKWVKKGSLPRTEYTGKTKYAQVLAEHSGEKFTAEWLMKNANPDAQATV